MTRGIGTGAWGRVRDAVPAELYVHWTVSLSGWDCCIRIAFCYG